MTIINIDFSNLGIPNDLISIESLVEDYLSSIPDKIGNDGLEQSKIARKVLGRKVVRKYIREVHEDFFESAKLTPAPFNRLLQLKAEDYLSKRYSCNFDNQTSPMRLKIIYQFLAHREWWK